MKTKFYQIALLCIAFLGMANVVSAQTVALPYDPFTSDNVSALTNTEVVTEGSYHTYTYEGDASLTGSIFVFKVVGGTIVDAVGAPALATLDASHGAGTHSILEADNKASIIVKWDAEVSGVQKYVAAYEISSTNCIMTNKIGGLKISVGTKPIITLALTDLEACSNDGIPVDITITNGESPWTATIYDGSKYITFYFSTGDATGAGYDHAVSNVTVASNAFTYNWVATGYLNTNVGTDETYTFEATKVDDKITSAETNDTGILGADVSVTATVHPLPVVGSMGQDL